MRFIPLVFLLVASCGGTSSPPASTPSVANVAPAPATLRIARVAPRIGSIRTERTVTRGGDREVLQVTRVEVLAVEGFATTKARITYLEAGGDEAALAGKTYVLARRAGHLDVVPDEGTPPGDEELVRQDNRTAGEPDSTLMMVTDRAFDIGKPVAVPPPPSLPPGTSVSLTLRSFDATTATFDVAIDLVTDQLGLKANGRMVIDRATGLEILASMSMNYTIGGKNELGSLELEATTE